MIRWVDDRTQDDRCPVCGAEGSKFVRLEVPSPFPGRGVRTLLQCPACTSQFFADRSLPPPSYEDTGAAIKYYIEQAASIEHMIWPLLRIGAPSGASLLDIGCGFGFALDFARSVLGWQARGIDGSAAAQTGARLLGLDIIPADLDGARSVGGERFDVVLGSEVLEHIPDPGAFLRSVASVLRERGTVVLTTPNAAAIRAGQPTSELVRILSPGFHHVFFTARSLRALIEQGGFDHVHVEEEHDSLKVYASRAPLALRPLPQADTTLYQRYLAVRGADATLHVDVRMGILYRHFKLLVNAGAWQGAEAAWAALRALVRDRYGFDLDAPDAVPLPAALPLEPPPDAALANAHFERFAEALPCSIVGLLYFRAAVALGTGRSREAHRFFRGAGRAGVVARSLALTLGTDAEIRDLTKRSFLLGALALADVAPGEAVAELQRIVRGDPPAGVPGLLWDFNPAEREWLLGEMFGRLTDRGHAGQAEIVFGDLASHMVATHGLDLMRPASISAGETSADGLSGASRRGDAGSPPAVVVDVPRVLCARGLLTLNGGNGHDALPYFRQAARILRESNEGSPATRERALLLARAHVHAVLALSAVDPEAAVIELQAILAASGPGRSSPDWGQLGTDRLAVIGSVFVQLVNRGDGRLAAQLASEVEAALDAGPDTPPDVETLAGGPDVALDTAFCRAMLALNHERASTRAAVWFHRVYEAAFERLRRRAASASAQQLVWTARYHEALALVQCGRGQAAVGIVKGLRGRPRGLESAPWPADSRDRLPIVGSVFVQLVNRGDGSVAAQLAADVEAALDAERDRPPDLASLAAGTDLALDAAFCRAMHALNHERAFERAAAWFHRVHEAGVERLCGHVASSSVKHLAWAARYHEALALVQADQFEPALCIVQSLRTSPAHCPAGTWPGPGAERLALLGPVFVQLVNLGRVELAAELAADVETALGAASDLGPDVGTLAAASDGALASAFCRGILALNHERAFGRAATWFHAVHAAAVERWRRGNASPAAQQLLWRARYHQALSLTLAGDRDAAASAVEGLTSGRVDDLPSVPRALTRAARALTRRRLRRR